MPKIRAKPVPFDVALLRESLMKAFMTGDLDNHARLTQELKAVLDAKKVAVCFFASLPGDPASVKFELGTLEPFSVE
jgi:hypothetical protein